jgi:hypothetical protein
LPFGRELNVLAALPVLVLGPAFVSGTTRGRIPWTVKVTLPPNVGVSGKGGETIAPTVHDEQLAACTGPVMTVVVANPGPEIWVCNPCPIPAAAPAAPPCTTDTTTPNASADSMNSFVTLAPRFTTRYSQSPGPFGSTRP